MSEAVREGYKETKIGVIPEDWRVKKLGNIGSFSKGRNISKAALKETGLPCVIYGDLYTKHHDYIKSITHFIDQQQAELSYEIEYGDILFATSGETSEEIGKCAVYLDNQPAFAGGDIVVYKSLQNDPKYLGYLLNYYTINKQKYRLAQGYSVVHIYASHLKNIYIPIPPLSEQKKIAEILSTWDRAIETLEQLIARKEELKRGLMQQLLSGKTRFPGFEGEWEVRRIGELVKTFSGGTPNRSKHIFYNGNIPWIKSGELNKRRVFSTEERISEEGLKKSSAKIVNTHTLLLAIYGATAGVISVNMIDKAAINQAILALIPNKLEIYQDFLELWFSFNKERIVHAFTQGGQPNLSAKIIKSLKIMLPSLKEQKKISKLLFTVNEEIECAKTTVLELRNQKKGLMQQLLTGKTRVSAEEFPVNRLQNDGAVR